MRFTCCRACRAAHAAAVAAHAAPVISSSSGGGAAAPHAHAATIAAAATTVAGPIATCVDPAGVQVCGLASVSRHSSRKCQPPCKCQPTRTGQSEHRLAANPVQSRLLHACPAQNKTNWHRSSGRHAGGHARSKQAKGEAGPPAFGPQMVVGE